MPENNSNPSFREQVNTYFPLQPGKMNMAAFLTGVGTPEKGQYIQNALDFGSQGVAAFLMGLQGAKDRQQDAFNPEAQTFNPGPTPLYSTPSGMDQVGVTDDALENYLQSDIGLTGNQPQYSFQYGDGDLVPVRSTPQTLNQWGIEDPTLNPMNNNVLGLNMTEGQKIGYMPQDFTQMSNPSFGGGDSVAFSREAGDSMDDTGEEEYPDLLTELMKADVFRTNTPVESLYNMGSILGTKTSDLTDRYGKFGKAIKPMGATASGLSAALQSAKSFAAGEGLTNRSQYVRDRNLEEMRRMLTEQGQEMGRQDMFNDEYLRYYGAGFKDGGEKQGLIEVEPGTYYNAQTDEFLIQD